MVVTHIGTTTENGRVGRLVSDSKEQSFLLVHMEELKSSNRASLKRDGNRSRD